MAEMLITTSGGGIVGRDHGEILNGSVVSREFWRGVVPVLYGWDLSASSEKPEKEGSGERTTAFEWFSPRRGAGAQGRSPA